jgi:drug/metabolite transporter (DMT)-like permease
VSSETEANPTDQTLMPSPTTLATSTNQNTQRQGFTYTVVAVVFFASSAVLVLYADPVPAIEKTFWRMVVASLFVFSLLKLQGGSLNLKRRDLSRFALYGLIAALHFSLYIASLNFTTVAHALTIIYTAPVFVTIFSAIFLHESIQRRKWWGVAVVALGVAVLAGFEPTFNLTMLFGDIMAFGSAVAFGFYSIAGRRERDNYPLLSYASAVYGFAAFWLLPLAAFSFFSGSGVASYGGWQILAIIGLGIIPLGIGHTLYNAGLRRLHATYVNIIASQEVTFGVLLAWLLRNQQPSPNTLLGVIITLVGILLVLT